MSESAWLVCDSHQLSLGLGEPVRDTENLAYYFYDGSKNSVNTELTKALWKFMAEHWEHGFRIVSSYSPDFPVIAGYREIGSDATEDLGFPEYLGNWPG